MLKIIAQSIGCAAYLGLAILGWGSVAGFFAQPALVALTIVFILLTVGSFFVGGSLSAGVREDRGNRWVLPIFVIIGFVSAYLPAYCDRIDFWTFGGTGLRWMGAALFAIGGVLRLVPVVILGHRFSGLVAIQPDHKLVTTGLYGIIRHPSYLGLVLNSLGWALAFRSGVGVLLTALTLIPLVARITAEERLLQAQFDGEYDAYRARTARLIPGIY